MASSRKYLLNPETGRRFTALTYKCARCAPSGIPVVLIRVAYAIAGWGREFTSLSLRFLGSNAWWLRLILRAMGSKMCFSREAASIVSTGLSNSKVISPLPSALALRSPKLGWRFAILTSLPGKPSASSSVFPPMAIWLVRTLKPLPLANAFSGN